MFCKENIDWELFFDQVGQSEQKLLMLDYDGTLAPFRPERSQAKPYSQVRELLEQLAQRPDQRLVLITGRRVHELTSLLALSVQPEVWGCHGLEHLTQDGSYQIQELDEQSLSVLSALDNCPGAGRFSMLFSSMTWWGFKHGETGRTLSHQQER